MKKISNVSTTLIVNSYECFYYTDKQNVLSCQNIISKRYNSKILLAISRKISDAIETEILHESSHNFEPFGDSGSLLIQADLNLYNSATLHLKESHITFHTYIEDILDNFAIVRLEYHISSCSDANVYNSLNDIILISEECFFPDLVAIDYIRRGAKYGNKPDDIIYDTNNPNFNGIIGSGYPREYSDSDPAILTGGYGPTSQEVMIPAFLAAYTGRDPSNSKLTAFPDIPLPNWRITYDGFIRILNVCNKIK